MKGKARRHGRHTANANVMKGASNRVELHRERDRRYLAKPDKRLAKRKRDRERAANQPPLILPYQSENGWHTLKPLDK